MPKTDPDFDLVRASLSEVLASGDLESIEEAAFDVLAMAQRLHQDNLRLGDKLLRLMRGRSRGGSEKLSPEQLALFTEQAGEADEELAAEVEAIEQEKAQPKGKRKGPKRRPLPEDLPVVPVEHDLTDDELPCPACGERRSCIGHEVSRQLDFVPAKFRVLEHRRAKYACRSCDRGGLPGQVVIADAPARPIPGGLPTSSMLAEVVVGKYTDHTPVHRQVGIYERLGVSLARSTLYGWVFKVARELKPLAKRIRALALTAHLLQVDDTGVVVLDKSADGGSRRGHIWSCLGDGLWAGYQYTEDWKAEGPEAFLSDRVGWMQADAYAGFDRLYEPMGGTAIEVACWAHARRYLVKAKDAGDFRAARPLRLIQKIFRIERQAKDRGLSPEALLALRKKKTDPLRKDLGKWLATMRPKAPPDEPLGKAITYFTNQWAALRRFCQDGRLPMTNNDCERSLRGIAVGRANWMFCGSDEGAEAAAVLLTCLGTAKLAGVNPRAWLADVLDKLANGWKTTRLDELLPPNWKAGQAS